jgi:hypothetical protein
MPSPQDPAQLLKIWAVQSVSAAINIRFEATSKQLTPESLSAANEEAKAIAKDIWGEALAECDPKGPGQVVIMKVSQKVFDWCYAHMNPDS